AKCRLQSCMVARYEENVITVYDGWEPMSLLRKAIKIAATGLLGVGFGLASADVAAQQSVLRIALSNDIRSIDPGLNRDGNTDSVVMHMVEGLVTYREDTSVGPMLAKSVEVSPDGRTYTFRLRDGVKFHNGKTLTSDDVVFTWNRFMDARN